MTTVDYFYAVLNDLTELRRIARTLDSRFGKALVFWCGPDSGVMDSREGLWIVPRNDLAVEEQGEGLRRHLIATLGETVGDRLAIVTAVDQYAWWNTFSRTASEPAPAPVVQEVPMTTEARRMHAFNESWKARRG